LAPGRAGAHRFVDEVLDERRKPPSGSSSGGGRGLNPKSEADEDDLRSVDAV